MSTSDFVFAFIQCVMVLATWSYVYKDNVLSKTSAMIVIAISTVHFFMVNMRNVYNAAIIPIYEQGKFINIIPIILGLMLYFRLSKTKGWISSYAYAASMGLGTGAILSTIISSSESGFRPF